MLILTRRTTETVLLIDGGREIRVTVRAVDTGQVKIGVDAPKEVQILREELTLHTE